MLPTGGSVLLVEALLYEDGSGPLTAQLYSLNMLVQTEGRERSAAQYAALLTAAGFSNIQHRFTGKIYDALLAHKEAWDSYDIIIICCCVDDPFLISNEAFNAAELCTCPNLPLSPIC